MKKLLFISSILFLSISLFAQTSVPNGDFENLTNISYENPTAFPFSANDELAYNGLTTGFPVTKTTDSKTGTYALKLSTIDIDGDTTFAYVVNGQPDGENPETWTGVLPISEAPTGITLYYKYNQTTTDSAIVLVAFSKNGAQVGTYMGKFGGLKTSYTQYTLNFTDPFPLLITPDSVTIAFASSNAIDEVGIIGSEVIIDDVAFTGVTSQPTWLDGGFETWTTTSIDIPDNWYIEGQGVTKNTTNTTSGSSSVQLTSTLEGSRSRPSRVSNGYFENGCDSNCVELGGFPFTNQMDTLIFDYIYVPSGTDTASFYVRFKKDGTNFESTLKSLESSPTFTSVQIPFNLYQAPDSAIITFETSSWDTDDPGLAGSTLIIDDIHFASDRSTTGTSLTKSNISISPNPTTDKININLSNIGIESATIKLLSLDGNVVLSRTISVGNGLVDVSSLNKGTYIILIESGGTLAGEKLIIK